MNPTRCCHAGKHCTTKHTAITVISWRVCRNYYAVSISLTTPILLSVRWCVSFRATHQFWFDIIADAINNRQHTHTHPFNGPFPGLPRWAGTRKVKKSGFTEARDSEWQWHQLGHMLVCTLLQTNNHTSTQPLSFLQARCTFCRPTNSVRALKVSLHYIVSIILL